MSWLTPDVVAAVARHMNEDHTQDLLVMAGQPDAVSARVAGLDLEALHVEVTEADGAVNAIALPWPGSLTERADIRRYVVEMHTRALGVK